MLASRTVFVKLPRLHWAGISKVVTLRRVLAGLAGLALALAFPLPGWAGLAWVAPALLVAAAAGVTPGRAFRLGYLAGLIEALVSLRWLLLIPFPVGAVAGWLALSAYVALFPAAWTWFCIRSLGLSSVGGANSSGWRGAVRRAADSIARASWARRSLWTLSGAMAWVFLEVFRAHLFSGFPWNFLGVSQYQVTPLIQLASVTGVYGVSFAVAWLSLALFCTAARVAATLADGSPGPADSRPAGRFPLAPLRPSLLPTFRWSMMADLALPLVVVLFTAFAGAAGLVAQPTHQRTVRLALIQPSIPQRLIFDPAEATNRFNSLMELSRLALRAEPDVLVWPEASLPDFSANNLRELTNLVAAGHVWMVFGADDAEPKPKSENQYDFFNAAFLLGPSGEYVARYRKRRLVIFGEYVPLEDWLPFTKYLTPIQGSFRGGGGPVVFETTRPHARFAPLICFEDTFPHGVPDYVRDDTDFLLNLTNNGWFGESSAQWQHAANAAFRAVENGLPLVRCTNNGLTCWIDERGRFREIGVGEGFRAGVYGAGFALVNIPLRTPGQVHRPTFYHTHGDWFAWSCLSLPLVALARDKHARRRWRGSQRGLSPATAPR